MKKVSFLLLLLMVLTVMIGCSTEKFNNPELIKKTLDKTIETTQQAIENKDVKLARTLWSQTSEIGIKADDLGEKKLAESLGQLASTYVYLINYIEYEDNNQLKIFNGKFELAISQLKEQLEIKKEISK